MPRRYPLALLRRKGRLVHALDRLVFPSGPSTADS
jgi:hypothetical protein